jgi:hypothetical protein
MRFTPKDRPNQEINIASEKKVEVGIGERYNKDSDLL